MIKIYCLYYEGKYTTDYISRLYRGLKRNSKVDFKFICLSDSDVEADEVIPLEKDSIIAEHWHKLKFFDKQFTGEGDIIVMDIDQIIVSDITDMIGWPVQENELVSYKKWWSKNKDSLPINGGWYKFKAGSLQYVWEKYNNNPEKWQLHYYHNSTVHFKYFGDQNFVHDTVVEYNGKITQMPGQWVAKYDKDIRLNSRYNMWYSQKFGADFMIMGDEVWDELKIIHFANVDNTIHEHPDGWIKEYWC